MTTMAQLRSRNPHTDSTDHRLSSFLPANTGPSMLYSMLPSALQSRLPRIPSLRCSVSSSVYGSGRERKSADSRPTSTSSTSSASSGVRTPDVEYISAVVRGDGGITAPEEHLAGYYEGVSSDEETAPKARQTSELTESKSGIGWKFANQGIYTCLSLNK